MSDAYRRGAEHQQRIIAERPGWTDEQWAQAARALMTEMADAQAALERIRGHLDTLGAELFARGMARKEGT